MRDMASDTKPAVLIGAATLSADNTPAAVDLFAYQGASIYLSVGIGGITFTGTNKIEFVLTHSDDDSSYANVAEADLIKDALAPSSISNGIVRSLTAAHAAATVQEIGYVGNKRYLKLLADFSGTHGAGTPISAVVVKGLPLTGPATV